MLQLKVMKKVGIIFLVIFTILMLARLLVGGGEDTWICEGGEWVKHGVPSAPKPEKPCGK